MMLMISTIIIKMEVTMLASRCESPDTPCLPCDVLPVILELGSWLAARNIEHLPFVVAPKKNVPAPTTAAAYNSFA